MLIVKKCKCLTWKTLLSELVSLKRFTDGGVGTMPPTALRSFVTFRKEKLF